jgi:hypothetical protein
VLVGDGIEDDGRVTVTTVRDVTFKLLADWPTTSRASRVTRTMMVSLSLENIEELLQSIESTSSSYNSAVA